MLGPPLTHALAFLRTPTPVPRACVLAPLSLAKGAWGKERWHLRVGFYSLDTCLGLAASLVTTLMFTAVFKVLGLPAAPCPGRSTGPAS